jgi:hypothetical protein
MDITKTGSFTYDSVIGIDTYLVLQAMNSSYMKRKLAIKGSVS